MKAAQLLILLLALVLTPLSYADVRVLALFKGAAMLEVDGKQKLLKVGQSWKGITLHDANSKRAIADVDGEEQTLTISQHITTKFSKPEGRTVLIRKDANLQYITTASINGRSTRVLIDTGANLVAISSTTAKSLGIKYEDGTPSQVTTASGIVKAHQITLESVDVSGLRVNHVRASVLEGNFPTLVLLGTTYLQHMEMSEKDGILMLIGKF
jgi:aspartyl protease family protein